MPLQPIRFHTLKDVYDLLNKMRDKRWISYSDDGNTITQINLQLANQFIVSTEGETYLLADIMALGDDEMLASKLSFPVINQGASYCYIDDYINVSTGRLKLLESKKLLCNRELTEMLLSANPTAGRMLNLQVPFTSLPMFVLGTIFSAPGKSRDIDLLMRNLTQDKLQSRVSQVNVADYKFNTPVIDLLKINYSQQRTYLAGLPKDNENTARIRASVEAMHTQFKTNLEVAKTSMGDFNRQYPLSQAPDPKLAELQDADLQKLAHEYVEKDNTVRNYSTLLPQLISSRNCFIIFCIATGITIFPPIIYLAIDRTDRDIKDIYRYRNELPALEARTAELKPFFNECTVRHLIKVQTLIIRPYLELMDFFNNPAPVLNAAPAPSNLIEPIERPPSPLRQLSLMQAATTDKPAQEKEGELVRLG